MDYEKVNILVKELISELEKDSLFTDGLELNSLYNQRFALLYISLKQYDRIYD